MRIEQLCNRPAIVHRRGGSQNTSTISFTRSGGDTTQELTINVRVDDDNGYLRGNYWDPAPEIPTEVTFAANSTTAAMPLTVPDDQRDLPAAGLVTVQALPGDDCLLGRIGVTTSVTISASDNDTSQQLKFNWGWLDFLDDSWETGESYTRCVTNEDNECICTERHPRRGRRRADRNSAHRHRIHSRVPHTFTFSIFDNDGTAPRMWVTAAEEWVDEGEDVTFTAKRLPSKTPGQTVNVDDPCYGQGTVACFDTPRTPTPGASPSPST